MDVRYATDDIKEPMFCDEPFALSFPPRFPEDTLIKMKVCVCLPPCCLYGWSLHFKYASMKVRGIPNGAHKLSNEETKDILEKLEGNWKIVVLSKKNTCYYTDALVSNGSLTLSGGTRSVIVSDGNAPRKKTYGNRPRKQALDFFKDGSGTTYCDFAGSTFVKMDFEGGEVEFHGCLGDVKLLLQRLWRQQVVKMEPIEAQELSEEETKEILKKLDGNWNIVVGETLKLTFTYTDVLVSDDSSMTFSGGMTAEQAVPNEPSKTQINFFKDESGIIFSETSGATYKSAFVKMDFDGGEVELLGPGGSKMLLQRYWKQQTEEGKNGGAPRQAWTQNEGGGNGAPQQAQM